MILILISSEPKTPFFLFVFLRWQNFSRAAKRFSKKANNPFPAIKRALTRDLGINLLTQNIFFPKKGKEINHYLTKKLSVNQYGRVERILVQYSIQKAYEFETEF